MYVRPAIVTRPVRAAPLLLATCSVTVPSPAPVAPVLTEIHGSSLIAAHEQLGDAVTVTLAVPPAAPVDRLAGAMANVHCAGAAAWVMTTSCPATSTLPLRWGPVFAATLMRTSPLPVPSPLDVTAIHDTRATAVHAQNSCSVTAIPTLSPAAPTLSVVGETDALQVAASCVISARCPFTAIVPRRVDVDRFGAAEKGTVLVP